MSDWKASPMIRAQFLRFVMVGAAATATTYLVLIALVEIWAVNPVLASVVGYVFGIVVNYSLSYRFTFRSQQLHQVAFPRFVLVVAVGLGINTLVMHAGVNWLGLHYTLAQLLAVTVVVFWSYTAYRLWAFAA